MIALTDTTFRSRIAPYGVTVADAARTAMNGKAAWGCRPAGLTSQLATVAALDADRAALVRRGAG